MYAQARQDVAGVYDKAFSGQPEITVPGHFDRSTHVFHQYTMQINGVDRNKLQQYLASNDIPAMIYYPVPIHLQKAYLDQRYLTGDFPVTEQLCKTVLSLPIHTEMDSEQLEYITGKVITFLKKEKCTPVY